MLTWHAIRKRNINNQTYLWIEMWLVGCITFVHRMLFHEYMQGGDQNLPATWKPEQSISWLTYWIWNIQRPTADGVIDGWHVLMLVKTYLFSQILMNFIFTTSRWTTFYNSLSSYHSGLMGDSVCLYCGGSRSGPCRCIGNNKFLEFWFWTLKTPTPWNVWEK